MPEFAFETCTATLLFPQRPTSILVYAVMDAAEAAQVQAMLPEPPIIAALTVHDWNRELSPWPAAAVFKGGDFPGGGPAFLRSLEQEILPACEAALPWPVTHRMIAGYSLAGLFALWACACGAPFDAAASVSGSLWFDGFPSWLEAHMADFRPSHVYLSLGDAESKARNPRMARVGACTGAVLDTLHRHGIQAVFEHNPGGHFNHPEERMARGIDWLTQVGIGMPPMLPTS